MREPLPTGFMRNGFFAWPARLIKCADCQAEFETYSGTTERCQYCRPKHRKKWRTKFDKERKR